MTKNFGTVISFIEVYDKHIVTCHFSCHTLYQPSFIYHTSSLSALWLISWQRVWYEKCHVIIYIYIYVCNMTQILLTSKKQCNMYHESIQNPKWTRTLVHLIADLTLNNNQSLTLVTLNNNHSLLSHNIFSLLVH